MVKFLKHFYYNSKTSVLLKNSVRKKTMMIAVNSQSAEWTIWPKMQINWHGYYVRI